MEVEQYVPARTKWHTQELWKNLNGFILSIETLLAFLIHIKTITELTLQPHNKLIGESGYIYSMAAIEILLE